MTNDYLKNLANLLEAIVATAPPEFQQEYNEAMLKTNEILNIGPASELGVYVAYARRCVSVPTFDKKEVN